MKITDYKFLADENIRTGVIEFLSSKTIDAVSVHTVGMTGKTDSEIMQFAYENGYAILTHDSDFGTLAFVDYQPFHLIVYLRPGHFDAGFTIKTIEALLSSNLELTSPAILSANNNGSEVTVRVRSL